MSWEARLVLQLGELSLDVELSGGNDPVVLIGPNGSGKSTLLRLIAGARRPDRGWVRVDGRVLFDGEAGVDLPPERRHVGYVPQGYGLFPHLTVAENVGFGSDRLVETTLESFGLQGLADRFPQGLSGGEKQRVALARALHPEPGILLLDEPLAALDLPARRRLRRELIERLRGQGPALLVTHDPRDVEAFPEQIYVLESGRISQQGALSALQHHPASEFVAEFLG